MKKLILLMSVVAIAIGFAGCNNDDPTERQREAIANQSLIGHWCTTKIQYNEGGKWYEVKDGVLKDNIKHHGYLEFRNDKDDNTSDYNSLYYYFPALGETLDSYSLDNVSWEVADNTIQLYQESTHEKYDAEITFGFTDIDKAVFKFPYKDSYVTVHMTRLNDFNSKNMALNNTTGERFSGHKVSMWQYLIPKYENKAIVGFIISQLSFASYEMSVHLHAEFRVLNSIDEVPEYMRTTIEYNGVIYDVTATRPLPLMVKDYYRYFYTFTGSELTLTPRGFADFHTYPAKCENDKLTISVDGVDYVFNKVTIKSE